MKTWMLHILVSLFGWWVFSLQGASVRIARSSNNYSEFVHHELEQVLTTAGSTEHCVDDPKPMEQQPERRRRAILNGGRTSTTQIEENSTTYHIVEGTKPTKIDWTRRRREAEDLITVQEQEMTSTTQTEDEAYTTQTEDEAYTMTEMYEEAEYSFELEDLYSEDFLKCSESGFSTVARRCVEVLANGSIYIPIYQRLFNATDFIPVEDSDDFYLCPKSFQAEEEKVDNKPKFSHTLAIVSLVGSAISTVCIVLHIVMFFLLPKLRNLPGYCLLSLCIALLVAYICLFIPYNRKEPSDCTVVGITKAYFFLASFFWMNIMAYDIWRSLRMATAKLRLTGDKPILTRFALYSAYSWGFPLLIIIFGHIVNVSDSMGEYRMVISDDSCWFTYKAALLIYFATPLFSLLILNVLLFMSSFYMISKATMNTSENKADLWSRFLVSIRLAVVMGLMWIFGVLATATEYSWLWYFNVVCNVLQGVFIFFSFTLTQKTRDEFKKTVARKKSSVFPTSMTTSSQPSTSV